MKEDKFEPGPREYAVFGVAVLAGYFTYRVLGIWDVWSILIGAIVLFVGLTLVQRADAKQPVWPATASEDLSSIRFASPESVATAMARGIFENKPHLLYFTLSKFQRDVVPRDLFMRCNDKPYPGTPTDYSVTGVEISDHGRYQSAIVSLMVRMAASPTEQFTAQIVGVELLENTEAYVWSWLMEDEDLSRYRAGQCPVKHQHTVRASTPAEVSRSAALPERILNEIMTADELSVSTIHFIASRGSDLFPTLLPLFHSGQEPVAMNAARAFAIAEEDGTDILVEGLRHRNPSVRVAALVGLVWADDPPVGYMAARIADDDETVRIATAAMLSKCGERGAFYLTQALADPDSEIRFAATNGLMLLMDNLGNALGSDDEKIEEAVSLVHSGPWGELVSRLKQHEDDPDFRVRTNVAVILKRVGLLSVRRKMLRDAD